MPAFAYTAVDSTGKKVSGDLNCRNKSEVYRELEAKALSPVSVQSILDDTAAPQKKNADLPAQPVPLSRNALITLTEELADLLDAGLQLEQALKVLHERQQNKGIKTVAGILPGRNPRGRPFFTGTKKGVSLI